MSDFISKSGDAAFIKQRNLRREVVKRGHTVIVEPEVKYLKLIERLINFDKKRDQAFIVHENGGISCFDLKIK